MPRRFSLAIPGPSQDGPVFFRAALAMLAVGLLGLGPHPGATATPAPADPAAPLEGTAWSLVAWGAGATDPGPASLTLRTRSGRKLIGGTTACGRFSGAFDLFAGRLRIFPAGEPAEGCAPSALEERRRLFDVLKKTANYRIAGAGLTLLAADGTVLARFAPRPAP